MLTKLAHILRLEKKLELVKQNQIINILHFVNVFVCLQDGCVHIYKLG